MRIAEICSQDLRRDHPTPLVSPQAQPTLAGNGQEQEQLLCRIESLIRRVEDNASIPANSHTSSNILSDLRQSLTRFCEVIPLSNTVKLQIWKLSYRLWNSCVDISNSASLRSSPNASSAIPLHVGLRHVSADMLFLAVDVSGVPSPATKCASFYLKTGLIYHDSLKDFDAASSCFERATEIVAKIDNVALMSDPGEKKLLLEINLARSRTAWELTDRNLAVTLLNRSKCNYLFGSSDHYVLIAVQYLEFGKSLLSLNKESAHGNSLNEAFKLLNEAFDLCEKGLGVASMKEQIVELRILRVKALRFMTAVHLQRGEFENVIKCVRVLRETSSAVGGDNHPSLPVLAMKAWLGLGRYIEAEKELKSMVVNKGVPEGVWVGAIEDYFESAGTAGAETAKGVFLELLGRCHVSASATVRVTRRVIVGRRGCGNDGGEEARVRAKVVVELVSDNRVLGLFEGEHVQKERKAMHAVLWDCASEHFRLKDYNTSAEMFEKSLLYIPNNVENRMLRAKGYRVLCLCYLALSQLDRALEYVEEADKLEPNISSAFLKYKINLQNKNYDDAVSQILAMKTCHDFSPEFLLLSSHEAVACHAFPVAVAALTNLLALYPLGKTIPVSEVVTLRSLIMMLSQDTQSEAVVLKFLKLAHSRALEIENFYGAGEVARREQNWFGVTSWNFATKCGKERNYEFCKEFFCLAAEFFIGLSDEVMVCKCLILAVCSVVALENYKKSALPEADLRHAMELLERAEKILKSRSTELDKVTSLECQLSFMYTVVAYDIVGRRDHHGSNRQLLLVRNFASSRACNTDNLLQLGLLASQGSHSNGEVAIFALNECLSSLLSSPSPDYHNVAIVLRKLITVTSIFKGDSNDESVLTLYKQAYRIMVGLKDGEFPSEEGKWLAMTAWNRAALPLRLGQAEVGKKWMNIGLEIAKNVVGMETYTACMQDSLSTFPNIDA